jgi:hypothetical protein
MYYRTFQESASGAGGGASLREKSSNMRVETPPVSAFFVITGDSQVPGTDPMIDTATSASATAVTASAASKSTIASPTTQTPTSNTAHRRSTVTTASGASVSDVATVKWLWSTLATVSGSDVELRSGNWVLEDLEELTTEYVEGRWELVVLYKGYGNHLRFKHVEGMLELSGSATATAHQHAAQFGDELTDAGFARFGDYFEGRAAARRVAEERRAAARRGRGLRFVFAALQPLVRVDQAIVRNMEVLIDTAGFAWRQFRDGVVFCVAAASLIGLEILPRLVGTVAVATVASTVMILMFRLSAARRYSANILR